MNTYPIEADIINLIYVISASIVISAIYLITFSLLKSICSVVFRCEKTSFKNLEKRSPMSKLHLLKSIFLIINTLTIVTVEYLILDGNIRLLFFIIGTVIFLASSYAFEVLAMPTVSRILEFIIGFAFAPLYILLSFITKPARVINIKSAKS